MRDNDTDFFPHNEDLIDALLYAYDIELGTDDELRRDALMNGGKMRNTEVITSWPKHGQVVDFVTMDGAYHTGVYDKEREMFFESSMPSVFGGPSSFPDKAKEGDFAFAHSAIMQWAEHDSKRSQGL